jgi:Mobilization protein NikA
MDITDKAKKTGMTASAFLRAAAVGLPVRSVLDLEAIETMATINREQGRLVDLLGQLDNTVGPNAEQLLTQIEIVQAELVRAAKRVRT